MELRDILGEPPSVRLNQDSTAMDAISAMVENKVRAVLVDRKDTDDEYGIITTRDIIYDVVAKGLDPSSVKVNDISSRPLIVTNNLDLDIRWVAKKMCNEGISRLAVFDGEELKCLVTDVDVLKGLAKGIKATNKTKARKGGKGQ